MGPQEGLRKIEPAVRRIAAPPRPGIELRILSYFVLPLVLFLLTLLGLLVRSFPGPGDVEVVELAMNQPVHVAADRAHRSPDGVWSEQGLSLAADARNAAASFTVPGARRHLGHLRELHPGAEEVRLENRSRQIARFSELHAGSTRLERLTRDLVVLLREQQSIIGLDDVEHRLLPRPVPVLLRCFAGTFVLTLSNPATIFSFIAICGSMAGRAATGSPALMVGGVLVEPALWWLALSSAVGRLRERFYARWRRRVNLASAAVLAGFALWQLLSLFAG